MTSGPRRRLDLLADGTVRQQSPVSGTVVWTVPGRSRRPLRPGSQVQGLPEQGRDAICAFCSDRCLETPPEKARLLRDPAASASGNPDPAPGAGATRFSLERLPGWQAVRNLTAEQVTARAADVRRIPNLYEILPWSFWAANFGGQVPTAAIERAEAYLATPAGRAHVLSILAARARTAGARPTPPNARGPATEHAGPLAADGLLQRGLPLFAGMHDLIVGRRHFVEGATRSDDLCAAGDLEPSEHHAFICLTVDAMRELASAHPSVRYVSAFQNWLSPAGATFDHLHKQLVAIDEHGPLLARIISTLRVEPDLFNTQVVDPAIGDHLVIAGNDHALALAGVGHRYPTVELYSTGPGCPPWEQGHTAVRDMADLLHACHAATGRLVSTNEEWHYLPSDVEVAMPWRIHLKWRVSTLAGFEGGTKINVNTISPFELRDRMVHALATLRAQGRVAELAIGKECHPGPAPLHYLDR